MDREPRSRVQSHERTLAPGRASANMSGMTHRSQRIGREQAAGFGSQKSLAVKARASWVGICLSRALGS